MIYTQKTRFAGCAETTRPFRGVLEGGHTIGLNLSEDQYVLTVMFTRPIDSPLCQGRCNTTPPVVRVNQETMQVNGLDRLLLKPDRAGVGSATTNYRPIRRFGNDDDLADAPLHEHFVRVFFKDDLDRDQPG